LDLESRLNLVSRNTEEIITRDELKVVLETKSRPRAYWGFEASGLMHIGMGLVCGRKILDLLEAGFDFNVFLADWHSWINNKLGGKMENIQTCGEYFKQCFTAIGISPSRATYSWASELASRREYWERVVRVGKSTNVSRVWRALPIMGREMDSKDLEAASTFYPCMQVADIFELELDVACAGIDQRKAHALARDVGEIVRVYGEERIVGEAVVVAAKVAGVRVHVGHRKRPRCAALITDYSGWFRGDFRLGLAKCTGRRKGLEEDRRGSR
jgi:tyrosyl-tRNA synthetase